MLAEAWHDPISQSGIGWARLCYFCHTQYQLQECKNFISAKTTWRQVTSGWILEVASHKQN